MTYEDEKNFLEAIRQFGAVMLLRNTFSMESEKGIQSLEPVGTTINEANLSVVNVAIGSEIKIEFFSLSRSHCIDLAESEVVQFNRCTAIETWLVNGRLWFDEKSIQGKKSTGFLKWANSILKWIRSNYEQDATGNFIGPHASELSRAGKLQLGPPIKAPISLAERKKILGLQ